MSEATNHPHHLAAAFLHEHSGGPYKTLCEGHSNFEDQPTWSVYYDPGTGPHQWRPVVLCMPESQANTLAAQLNREWAHWNLEREGK